MEIKKLSSSYLEELIERYNEWKNIHPEYVIKDVRLYEGDILHRVNFTYYVYYEELAV